MGFTLSIQPSLFDKISNSGIGPVPTMVEADTTWPSRTGIDRDFEPCFYVTSASYIKWNNAPEYPNKWETIPINVKRFENFG